MAVIMIAGDIYAGGCNELSLSQSCVSEFSAITELFATSDLAIANLESPLAENIVPCFKAGPSLCANPRAAQGIAACGIGVVNLANNHMMDFGTPGLESTIQSCRNHGIATFGAGRNCVDAGAPLIIDVGGLRLGLLGIAEHDGVVATDTSAGPLAADPVEICRWFRDNRPQCDRVVVLVHGGLEHFQFPPPRLKALCRFLVDCGADAVICQHTHIVGCQEIYKERPIVYGQGNFLFDYPVARRSWWEGLVVELEIAAAGPVIVRYHPISSRRSHVGVRLERGAEGQRILAGFLSRSEQLSDAALYASIWQSHCEELRLWYLDWLDGVPRLLKKLDRRFPVFRMVRSRKRCIEQHNVIACESHREILLSALAEAGGLGRDNK